jgi:hypothetical protein
VCPGFPGDPRSSTDGKSLLIWSGPTWGNFTVVRLWSLEALETAEWKDENFKEIAPPWLPDLADVVIGQGGESSTTMATFTPKGKAWRSLR